MIIKNIYESVIGFKNDILYIRNEFGDPRCRVIIFDYSIDGIQPYYQLKPNYVVSTPPRQFIGLPLDPQAAFTIGIDDYFVTDVSRDTPREVFQKRAWLDGSYNALTKSFTGVSCRVHIVTDTSGVGFDILLKKEYEQTHLPS